MSWIKVSNYNARLFPVERLYIGILNETGNYFVSIFHSTWHVFTFNDILPHDLYKMVSVRSRLFMPKPKGVENLVHDRAWAVEATIC